MAMDMVQIIVSYCNDSNRMRQWESCALLYQTILFLTVSPTFLPCGELLIVDRSLPVIEGNVKLIQNTGKNGRCSRPGPLFYLLKRGGRGAVDIPARLLYTDWSSFPVILVALRVDSGVPKNTDEKAN